MKKIWETPAIENLGICETEFFAPDVLFGGKRPPSGGGKKPPSGGGDCGGDDELS